jgi:hypothetical protein
MWPFSTTRYPIVPVSSAAGLTSDSESGNSATTHVYDYIIVGGTFNPAFNFTLAECTTKGGTAGCVLANRLSADPNTTVLLLERGPIVDTWASGVPLLSMNTMDKAAPIFKWVMGKTSNVLERVQELMAGKAMGGTSAGEKFSVVR